VLTGFTIAFQTLSQPPVIPGWVAANGSIETLPSREVDARVSAAFRAARAAAAASAAGAGAYHSHVASFQAAFLGMLGDFAFDFEGETEDPQKVAVSKMLYIVFILMTFVAIFTLLIAMMTTTYMRVKHMAAREYSLGKTQMGQGYMKRAHSLPPPANVPLAAAHLLLFLSERLSGVADGRRPRGGSGGGGGGGGPASPPGTPAGSRPGTAGSRPGTAGSSSGVSASRPGTPMSGRCGGPFADAEKRARSAEAEERRRIVTEELTSSFWWATHVRDAGEYVGKVLLLPRNMAKLNGDRVGTMQRLEERVLWLLWAPCRLVALVYSVLRSPRLHWRALLQHRRRAREIREYVRLREEAEDAREAAREGLTLAEYQVPQ
jgi:hypothetical protein